MRSKRPKNLNLFTIRIPLPAIVSFLHRISGFILFLLIPFALWLFAYSLTYQGFETFHRWLDNPFLKTFVWLLLIPFCYHLVAGLRHLLSDINIGDTLKGGRLSALLVIVISIVLILLMGIWLW